MGEAKRRKKLDPNYGKKSRPKNSLLTKPKKNPDSETNDQLFQSNSNNSTEENNLKDETRITLCFDFEIKATTQDNDEISNFGHIEHSKWINDIDYYEYLEDYSMFSTACRSVLEGLDRLHLSDVTITIKNMNIKEFQDS